MRVKAGTILIADNAAASRKDRIVIASLQINGQASVDWQDFPEAAEPRAFDRQNRSMAMTLETERGFSDEVRAFRFALEHRFEIPGVVDLEINGPRGGWKLFFAGSSIDSIDVRAVGSRCYCRYQIRTGEPSTKRSLS